MKVYENVGLIPDVQSFATEEEAKAYLDSLKNKTKEIKRELPESNLLSNQGKPTYNDIKSQYFSGQLSANNAFEAFYNEVIGLNEELKKKNEEIIKLNAELNKLKK